MNKTQLNQEIQKRELLLQRLLTEVKITNKELADAKQRLNDIRRRVRCFNRKPWWKRLQNKITP